MNIFKKKTKDGAAPAEAASIETAPTVRHIKKTKPQKGDAARKLREGQRDLLQALPGLHWLVLLLTVAALAAAGFALVKVKTVAAAAKTRSTATTQPATYALVKSPLTAGEYQATLEWFRRLHSTVQYEQHKNGGLRMYISDGANHGEWLYALGTIAARDQDIVWEADELCIGRCGGPAAQAVIRGYRQKIEKK